jgi:hypothetical protein
MNLLSRLLEALAFVGTAPAPVFARRPPEKVYPVRPLSRLPWRLNSGSKSYSVHRNGARPGIDWPLPNSALHQSLLLDLG